MESTVTENQSSFPYTILFMSSLIGFTTGVMGALAYLMPSEEESYRTRQITATYDDSQRNLGKRKVIDPKPFDISSARFFVKQVPEVRVTHAELKSKDGQVYLDFRIVNARGQLVSGDVSIKLKYRLAGKGKKQEIAFPLEEFKIRRFLQKSVAIGILPERIRQAEFYISPSPRRPIAKNETSNSRN